MESALRTGLAIIAVSLWLSPLAFALPAGEGESLVREHCSSCHRPEILNRAQGYNTASEWRQLMATMVALDEPRADIIARYLERLLQSGVVPSSEGITLDTLKNAGYRSD